MSNALESRFAQVADEGRSALVVYLPVGFPDVRTSCAAMVAAVEAGADVIEIGIPYTDPVMDGPVIQNAADRALEQGAGVPDALECARAVAAAGGVPVAVAALTTEPASTSASVTMYIAVPVALSPTARSPNSGPDTQVRPGRLSVMVTSVSATLPVLVTVKV